MDTLRGQENGQKSLWNLPGNINLCFIYLEVLDIMTKDGILNPEIISSLTAIGHTEYLVIADSGLPLPAKSNINIIDLSLVKGIPSFIQVLDAVMQKFVIESYILAEEITEKNKELYRHVGKYLSDVPEKLVSHEEFKELTKKSHTIIRTGEATPYANVILVGGVNF